ncbi:DUF6445 family protein [Paraferrimonas sp. SM1919]|uniref:DUF6445 family protein n=1 Tax=Paraferrimonas sp. SM1919 TaxID=2662263 RepID=UPI0013D67265|nr:DUF6445 family protein [Paraferrimonas sp. SM1919]
MNADDIKLNPQLRHQLQYVGTERVPVIVIDDAVEDYDSLLTLAGQGSEYQTQSNDFYPGIRKPIQANYIQQLCEDLLPVLQTSFNLSNCTTSNLLLSAFSIATTQPHQLRPIQTVPHFDTTANNQLAIVHYLCEPEHGGTSFYRHRQTGFERISEPRLEQYSKQLKQQAVQHRLHLNPSYINGSNELFECTATIAATPNRLIIYPSNCLHSGDIQAKTGLSASPLTGRLTTSSFIEMV